MVRPVAEIYRIGELSREFGVTPRTIRFYEDRGLLKPRRQGRARIFGPRERVRLRLILRGKRLGFSLDEITEVLRLYDEAPGEAGQLRHLIDKIAERRAVLQRQREDIAITLSELDAVEARCRERLRDLDRG
jgi:DNA-binding transcriptional MerR regulator